MGPIWAHFEFPGGPRIYVVRGADHSLAHEKSMLTWDDYLASESSNLGKLGQPKTPNMMEKLLYF